MKKIILFPTLFILLVGLGFAGPRLQLDLGAAMPDFSQDAFCDKPSFKYDLQFSYPIHESLDVFVKADQDFASIKNSGKLLLVNEISLGLDNSFAITQNDFFRPSIFAGLGIVNADLHPKSCVVGFVAGAKIYYIRQMTQNLQLNVGAGLSMLFIENQNPFKTHSPVDLTLGISYCW